MKICLECREEKSLDDFYRNKTVLDGRSRYCKKCSDARNKASRDKHPEKSRYNREKSRKRRLAHINEYKIRQGCLDCGENRHPIVLDLHHIDPTTKLDTIANMVSGKSSLIEEELKKCIVLCANCHRLRHAPEAFSG